MERRSQESFVDLIDSGQFLTAEEMFSERRTDDPLEVVIRSEVAMYFGKLNDAQGLLEQVKDRVSDIDVAARFSLAQGRLALRLDEDEQATPLLQSAYYFYLFSNAPFGISQALLELAKLARRAGRFEEAGESLKAALEKLEGRSNKKIDFLRGLIVSEKGDLLTEQGDADEAAKSYEEAAGILKGMERGRYYALALLGTAGLKYATGEFQDSLEIYKEAIMVFERYDLRQDRAYSQLKLATALLRLKRYERAERVTLDSREVYRGEAVTESQALAMLATLSLYQNEADDAVSYANKAIELAEQSKSAKSRVRAHIAMGIVKLHLKEYNEAAEHLSQAAEIARNARPSLSMRRAELEAVIYSAEAYHNFDTRAGRGELIRAGELLGNLDDAWLNEEFTRVSGKYEEQIQFTDDNRLVFDGNQLPRWHDAKRTLEGFLLRNALRQTNNSLTRAARKLGVSKVHVHNLKKKHGVE